MSTSDEFWLAILQDAAEQYDGGPRSFPAASDRAFQGQYGYNSINVDYHRFFYNEATVSNSQICSPVSLFSAGWMIPDSRNPCKPVFVAHSLLAAIWLIYKTLPAGSLPSSAWEKLVRAARTLSREEGDDKQSSDEERDAEPPSAQPPSAQSRAPVKRPAASPRDTPQKRISLRLSDYPGPEPVRVTITNHNRRAEQARQKRAKQVEMKRRYSIGLVEPSKTAPRKELAAYTAITKQDIDLISWIFKQPITDNMDFFTHTPTPYITASSMLEKARAIGNAASQASAAAFLRNWRQHGTPFAAQVVANRHEATPASSLTRRKRGTSITSALTAAWDLCDRYEHELDVISIKYRWAMAFLGQAYLNKIEQIEQVGRASGCRNGKKVRTEAMDALLPLVSSDATPQNRQKFKKRLGRAARWNEAVKALGWGILCLMPSDIISTNWVENEIRLKPWHIWLDLVAKANPNAYSASRELDSWLGSEGIAGGSISTKQPLYIEASELSTPSQVHEVEDSEDSEDEGDDLERLESTTSSNSPLPPRLSLIELCKPQ